MQNSSNSTTKTPNTQPPKSSTIIVIGDYCVDEYRYGIVNRISPEAPVPILQTTSCQKKCGMAGNVAKNLSALGAITKNYFSNTNTVKIRYIDAVSGQQLLRVDHDCFSNPFDVNSIDADHNISAVVVSDYNKGFVTKDTIEHVQEKYRDLPIFIDTKKQDLSFVHDNCYVKINEQESKHLNNPPKNLIVTRGSKSVLYGNKQFDVPTLPVFDVTGAGDTFLAALAYTYSMTNSIERAIRYAIVASSITVTKLGVYAPTPEEIDYET